ncbi:MAG TPA: oligosaccharide flippase family protein [Bacteroidota bacterium]|nr:oligosaccharide flippase family protein [Bacteroidota bacterium]
MSEPSATFKSALWNHAGRVVEYFLIYVTSVLIARSLGVEGNGTFASLISISQLLMVIVSFGLETSLNKHIPQLPEENRAARLRYLVRRVFLVRFGLVVFCSLGMFGIAWNLWGPATNIAVGYLWLLVGYTAVRSLASIATMVLIAQLKTGLSAKVNLAARLLECGGVVVLGSIGIDAAGILLLFVFTGLFQVLTLIISSRDDFVGRAVKTAVAPVFMFGGIYWANTIVEYFLGRQGDVLFLSLLLHETSQASLYDVAFSVNQLAALGMTAGLGGVTFAMFSRLAVSSSEGIERFHAFLVRVTSLLSIPLYVFILFNADSVVRGLYSPRYAEAAILIQGIAAFRIASRVFGGSENSELMLSKGMVGTMVLVGLIGAVVNITLNILLIPAFGASGTVVASGAANLLISFLGAIVVMRTVDVHIQWQFWLKLVMTCACASWLCSIPVLEPTILSFVGRIGLYVVLMVIMLLIAKPLTHIDSTLFAKLDSRLEHIIGFFVHGTQPASVGEPRDPRQ